VTPLGPAPRALSPSGSRNAARGLLVALHDVTPAHAKRLEQAERLLTALGINAVTYLLIPDFHARAPAHACADFIAWCRASRSYDVQWFLHGYFHREDVDASGPSVADWCARKFLTAGEGEFLLLRGRMLDVRLRAGVDSFRQCLGHAPSGFVAPAWLYNEELIPALARLRVAFTESHFHVFDLLSARSVPAPVLTWASRTMAHRVGSLAVTATERLIWARRPLVRLALHPADFGHQRLVDSIARSLDALRRDRVVVTYEQACAVT
jgi:predicted deacetylase